MALALLRLHAATGITEFLSAALDAMRCEETYAFPGRSGWPATQVAERDVRGTHASAGPPANWCRGVSGFGLARLVCVAGRHSGELRRSATRAIYQLARNADQVTDSLDFACCGQSGAIELLLSAGLRWGDSSLLAAAHTRASAMVRRSRASGHYRLSTSPATYVYDPALFRGMAGIGYGLLRLGHPELLPSFLSME
jgi:lantibiotic modifying enzyme